MFLFMCQRETDKYPFIILRLQVKNGVWKMLQLSCGCAWVRSFSLNCKCLQQRDQEVFGFLCSVRYGLCSHRVWDSVCVCVWFRSSFLFFPSSPRLDSIFPPAILSYIRSLWFCPASQFFMELEHFKEFFLSPLLLPRRSAGQVWERDCPSEVGCYQQGAACLQFRSALATDGDLKASHNASCDPSKHAC